MFSYTFEKNQLVTMTTSPYVGERHKIVHTYRVCARHPERDAYMLAPGSGTEHYPDTWVDAGMLEAAPFAVGERVIIDFEHPERIAYALIEGARGKAGTIEEITERRPGGNGTHVVRLDAPVHLTREIIAKVVRCEASDLRRAS